MNGGQAKINITNGKRKIVIFTTQNHITILYGKSFVIITNFYIFQPFI